MSALSGKRVACLVLSAEDAKRYQLQIILCMKIYRIRRVLSTGLKPSALADNPLDLPNSLYHTQPRAIIAQ